MTNVHAKEQGSDGPLSYDKAKDHYHSTIIIIGK